MWNWLRTLFGKLFRVFKSFIAVAFPIAKQIVMAELKDFAVSVVNELEQTDLSNESRRYQAFQKIQTEATKRGIHIGTSLIFCLIEVALQYIKEK